MVYVDYRQGNQISRGEHLIEIIKNIESKLLLFRKTKTSFLALNSEHNNFFNSVKCEGSDMINKPSDE